MLEDLEPKLVWSIFEDIFTKTPRESKKEDKIRETIKKWVVDKAKETGIALIVAEDETGNLLIKSPATSGMEDVQPLLLQGHMDMVCETDRPDGFDFETHAIPVQLTDDGEWVEADGTTLGADNGIGCALAMALMVDPDVKHGPLELLITVDEETGLVGAFGLDPEEMGIESRLMINIDSESLGAITIGSAGGGDTVFEKDLMLHDPNDLYQFMELTVGGLFGGHSGLDIDKPRGNANKLVARILSALDTEVEVILAHWNGGSKHNAITRESTVVFCVPKSKVDAASKILKAQKVPIMDYYKSDRPNADVYEPDLSIEWDKTDATQVFSEEESRLVIRTANMMPQGPIRFSPSVEGLVETSNNFAIIKTEGSNIIFHVSTRSSVDSELAAFRMSLADLGRLGGWDVTTKPSYPGWTPEPKSPFLQYVIAHYRGTMSREIEVEALHAGLECGIVGARIPGIQIVSIGPNIENAHTPDERLHLEDVGIIYQLLKSITADLGDL